MTQIKKYKWPYPSFLLLLLFIALQCSPAVQNDGIFKLEKVIKMPHVKGRIDHLAIDPKQQIVFIAARNNNSVEVVDLKKESVIHSIKGLNKPQGLVYLSGSHSVFVTNGAGGKCVVFDANTFQPTSFLQLTNDADNVRYDSRTNRIYIGYGDGAIAVVDATNYHKLMDISLPAHPEAFQLDSKVGRLFINVPEVDAIEVIDLAKKSVIDQWKLTGARANFPMAIDPEQHRLFIGCRKPSQLLILNSNTGKVVATLPCESDVDDIFYNQAAKQVYLSCGSGYLEAFQQVDSTSYKQVTKIITRSGARTSLFDSDARRILIAVPASFGKDAELRVYKIIN